jgi:hypothetical protein
VEPLSTILEGFIQSLHMRAHTMLGDDVWFGRDQWLGMLLMPPAQHQ